MRPTNAQIMAAAAAVLSCLLGFTYGNALGVSGEFNLQEWQSIIGTCIAVMAAAIAWYSIQRTLRMNLISREEDRIERSLPALCQAQEFVLHLSQELDALQCKENALAIFNQRFIPEDASLDEMVKRRLGLGDERLRQEVTDALRGAYLDARLLERADRNYRDAEAELINMDQCGVGGKAGIAEIDVLRTVRAEQERKFLTGARRVNELAHMLSERIARYRTRSIRFRSEMERFFERPILNE
jgi:hypothetical protein